MGSWRFELLGGRAGPVIPFPAARDHQEGPKSLFAVDLWGPWCHRGLRLLLTGCLPLSSCFRRCWFWVAAGSGKCLTMEVRGGLIFLRWVTRVIIDMYSFEVKNFFFLSRHRELLPPWNSTSHPMDITNVTNGPVQSPMIKPDHGCFWWLFNKAGNPQNSTNFSLFCLRLVFLVLSYSFSKPENLNAGYKVVKSFKTKIFDMWTGNLIFLGMPAACISLRLYHCHSREVLNVLIFFFFPVSVETKQSLLYRTQCLFSLSEWQILDFFTLGDESLTLP